jgi:hypothetical protein
MEIEIKTRQQGRQHDCIKAAIESGATMICASQAQADKLMAKYPGLKTLVKSDKPLLGAPRSVESFLAMLDVVNAEYETRNP